MKKIIGSNENISFPDFGITDVLAKIDTGADSGAFHCSNITETTKNGTNVITFTPFDHPEIYIETADFKKKRVRSSNGITENRYFIETRISIHGESYPITLSLADRSKMQYQVLLGRNFLQAHNFIVDVSLNTV